MGILITRGILIVLLFFIYIMISAFILAQRIKKLRLDMSQNLSDTEIKNYREKFSRRATYIMIPVFLGVMIITSYPFEGSFLRFDTPEASLKYSSSKSIFRENTFFEGERCYFVVSTESNNVSYHSISKYGDKFGVADYKSELKHLGNNAEDKLLTCMAIYDENSDSSCYFISYFLPDSEKDEDIVLIDDRKAECISFRKNSIAKYLLIVDGKFKEDVVINVNGIDRRLSKSLIIK